MSISKKEVERIAHLARLDLTEAEKDRFADQLSQILDHVEQLNELDTEGVEPTFHVIEMTNVFRNDRETPSLSRDETLGNAPQTDGRFFLVPRIIE